MVSPPSLERMVNPWLQVAPLDQRTLSDHHRNILLNQSGLTEEIIQARGYWSLTADQMAQLTAMDIYNKSVMDAGGWLAIPVYRPDKQFHCVNIRLDTSPGKGTSRYLWPKGYRNALDINPLSFPYLHMRDVPLVTTEGTRKADSILRFSTPEHPLCVIGVNGCWGWRGKTSKGGSIALPDWMDIALDDRQNIVISDSDFATNMDVRAGWSECAKYLASKTQKEHRVSLVVVPPFGMQKQGADDYFISGHSFDELIATAQSPEVATFGVEVPDIEIQSAAALLDTIPEEIPYLLHPLIPERSVMFLTGHSGTYKTWFATNLVLDLALGRTPFGNVTFQVDRPRTCVYVNKEMGAALMTDRLRKLTRDEEYACSADELRDALLNRLLVVHDARFDLADSRSMDVFVECLKEVEADLVVLDSLSMAWSGDEGSNRDVGVLYHRLRQISQDTGVAWLILHHLTKPTKERGTDSMFSLRGAGQFYQQADTVMLLQVHAQNGDSRVLSATHQKARTTAHLATALINFEPAVDDTSVRMTYLNSLSEYQIAQIVEAAGASTVEQRLAWVKEKINEFPGMPTDEGVLQSNVTTALLQHWVKRHADEGTPLKKAPSLKMFSRHVKELIDAGFLEVAGEDGPMRRIRIRPYELREDGSTDEEVDDE